MLLSFFLSVADPPIINSGFAIEPSSGDVIIGNAGCFDPGTPTYIICEVIVFLMTPYNVTLEKDGVQVAFIESDKSANYTFSVDSPGIYTCTASNIFGSDSASSPLYGKVFGMHTVCVRCCIYSGNFCKAFMLITRLIFQSVKTNKFRSF